MLTSRIAQMNKKLKGYLRLMAGTALLGSNLYLPVPTLAQTQLECIPDEQQLGSLFSNRANYNYNFLFNSNDSNEPTNPTTDGLTNSVEIQTGLNSTDIDIIAQGIRDGENNGLIVNLGTLADALVAELERIGLSNEEARTASLAGIGEFGRLTEEAISQAALSAVRTKIAEAVPGQEGTILTSISLSNILLALSGVAPASLEYYNLFTAEEIETIQEAASSATEAAHRGNIVYGNYRRSCPSSNKCSRGKWPVPGRDFASLRSRGD